MDAAVKNAGEERIQQLLYRHVGFELFDAAHPFVLPQKTYVAQCGRYVLLGFFDQTKADEFFEAAMKQTL